MINDETLFALFMGTFIVGTIFILLSIFMSLGVAGSACNYKARYIPTTWIYCKLAEPLEVKK